MAKRKSDRKAHVMEIVKEKEAEKAAQEASVAPEDEENEEKSEVEETEPTAETEKSETAGPKLVGKRRGRAPIEGRSLRRLLVFVSPEDLERLKEDGRPLSTIGREALKGWLERNQK